MASREEMLKQGYTCYCIACSTAYKQLPKEEQEDGHGGREIPMCSSCGCDLIADLKTDQPVS